MAFHVDAVIDPLHRAVAERHVQAAGVGAAEAGPPDIVTARQGCVAQGKMPGEPDSNVVMWVVRWSGR